MLKKINITVLLMQNCCSSRVLKRVYPADFSQGVAEIYEDYFIAYIYPYTIDASDCCLHQVIQS